MKRRLPAFALLLVVGLSSTASLCGTKNTTTESSWYMVVTIERAVDPVFGRFETFNIVGLQANIYGPYSYPYTGTLSSYYGVYTGRFTGAWTANDAILPATWRVWELTGPCTSQYLTKDLTVGSTFNLVCEITLSSGTVQTVDEEGNINYGNTQDVELLGAVDEIPGTSGTYIELPEASLASNQALFGGDEVTSPSGRFHLHYQTNGNLVLQDANNSYNVIWESGTSALDGAGSVTMETNGNLIIRQMAEMETDPIQWTSGTSGNSGAYLAIFDNGNMAIVRPSDGVVVWTSGSGIGGS